MKNVALRGKPHVWFDKGEVAPTATLRRGSLLYKRSAVKSLRFAAFVAGALAAPVAKCLVLVLGMSQCGLAADVWYDVANAPDRLWTTAAGWRYSGGALGRLPDSNDKVTLDGIQTGPDNPIVIPSGCDAVVQYLWISSVSGNVNNYAADGRIPSLTLNGTLQALNNNGSQQAIAVGYGAGGFGLMRIGEGAVITNANVTIGYQGIGVVTNSGGSLYLSPYRDLIIGAEQTGVGTYVQNSGSLSANSLLCGFGGRGTATFHSNMQLTYLKIGGSLNNVSEMTLLEGATTRVEGSASVGGYPMPLKGGGTTDYSGYGLLTLRGGTLHFYNTASSENFFLGQYADGWGCLRGYGKIAPKTTGATNIRLGCGNCIICADGEGVERALDLNECVNITNYFGESNVATSTNGWYAVNKGRVRFPRSWFSTASAERCIGDSPYAATPRFVNSMRCSFTGVSGNATFFRGGLYATDCESIPAGLPPGDVIGVWAFGLFNTVNGNTKVSFSTALPTFRYDHTKVRAGRTLNLYRHNGTAWVRVGKTMPNDDHLISAESALAPLNGGSMNIGFFAVVAPTPGMMVFVR